MSDCAKGVPCKKWGRVGAAKKKTISAVKVAASFTKSMAVWAASGMKVMSKAEHAKRYATCCTCEHMVGHMCTRCTCLAYAKTKLATEKCPVGKW